MKLSISTLGCPDWSFAQILENFEALGVEGIEVRGIEGQVEPDKIPYFFPENVEETRARLAAHHLKLVGFGTSASFHDPAKREANVAACKTAVDVCARVGIPAIRVFGNQAPEGEGREAVLRGIGEGIREVFRYANSRGVLVNLETHGNINSIESLRPILDVCGGEPSFGIIWDVAHSDKTTGDDFEAFYQFIKPYLRHMHIKDHLRGTTPPYKLTNLGRGDIPVAAIVRRVLADGYDGYFSFEWEKKWHPELDAPEIAFPEFTRYMRRVEAGEDPVNFNQPEGARRPLGLSTCGHPLTEPYVCALRASGVDSIELSYSEAAYKVFDWAAARRLADAYRLRLRSVHLPFSGRLSIAQLDPALRAAAVETDRAVMRAAAAVGVPIAVVHPSSEPIADGDRPAAMAYAKENLRALADEAGRLGMTLAVEDLPRTCLGRDAAEMAELLSADERLRVVFDTNHLLRGPIAGFVRAVGGKIVALHVSDYDFADEKHWLPGEGQIDWPAFMALLDEIDYAGDFTYELGFEQETRTLRRPRPLTPDDFRQNYDALCAGRTPERLPGTEYKI